MLSDGKMQKDKKIGNLLHFEEIHEKMGEIDESRGRTRCRVAGFRVGGRMRDSEEPLGAPTSPGGPRTSLSPGCVTQATPNLRFFTAG